MKWPTKKTLDITRTHRQHLLTRPRARDNHVNISAPHHWHACLTFEDVGCSSFYV